MGAGIAASPHCAERRICRCSVYLVPAARKLWFPASRSWLTSSGVAFHRTALSEEKPDFYSTALPEGSLVFRCPARLKTEVFAQNRPMFRGPSWGNHSCVPLRSPDPKSPRGGRRSRNRVALETDTSSGASSRLAPKWTRKSLPIACRRRSVLLSLPRPSCRFRLSGETGTSAPITRSSCTFVPSRGSGIFSNKPVDNGEIGNNSETIAL